MKGSLKEPCAIYMGIQVVCIEEFWKEICRHQQCGQSLEHQTLRKNTLQLNHTGLKQRKKEKLIVLNMKKGKRSSTFPCLSSKLLNWLQYTLAKHLIHLGVLLSEKLHINMPQNQAKCSLKIQIPGPHPWALALEDQQWDPLNQPSSSVGLTREVHRPHCKRQGSRVGFLRKLLVYHMYSLSFPPIYSCAIISLTLC